MLKAAFPKKGGFKWKHGADKVKKLKHRRGYMGYDYPDEVVLERTTVFDDNLYDAENEVSSMDLIQQSKPSSESKISLNNPKIIEYAADPLTGDAERLIEVGLQFQYKFYPVQGDHPWTVNLLILKAELLRRRADRTQTTKILLQAQAMMRRFLNPGHPDFATLLVAMGHNSRDNLNAKFALQCYEQAMMIRSAHFGGDHISIAECQLGIASALAAEGNVTGARDLISVALSTRVKWLPKSHPLVASAAQALAMSYLANNEWLEEARKMLKYAVEVKAECFGANHFEVCTCFNDYALVCKAMGLYSEAVSILQHIYHAQKKLYGDCNIDVAMTLHNHASVLLDTGNFQEAEPLFLDSLKIKRELFGFDHSIVGDALNNIGGLYQMMNRLDTAQKFYLEALHVRIRANGEINIGVAEVLNNLGILAFAKQKLDIAQDYLEKALAVKRKVCGPKDASLASTLHNLACVYHCMVAEEEARTLYEECLEIRKVALGPNHPDTIACMSNLDRLRSAIIQNHMRATSQSIASLNEDTDLGGGKVGQQPATI
jgi:tetratricopeptide (TPR) repeat protein